MGGTIKQLRVKVGDHVRRGQLIASVRRRWRIK